MWKSKSSFHIHQLLMVVEKSSTTHQLLTWAFVHVLVEYTSKLLRALHTPNPSPASSKLFPSHLHTPVARIFNHAHHTSIHSRPSDYIIRSQLCIILTPPLSNFLRSPFPLLIFIFSFFFSWQTFLVVIFFHIVYKSDHRCIVLLIVIIRSSSSYKNVTSL